MKIQLPRRWKSSAFLKYIKNENDVSVGNELYLLLRISYLEHLVKIVRCPLVYRALIWTAANFTTNVRWNNICVQVS